MMKVPNNTRVSTNVTSKMESVGVSDDEDGPRDDELEFTNSNSTHSNQTRTDTYKKFESELDTFYGRIYNVYMRRDRSVEICLRREQG